MRSVVTRRSVRISLMTDASPAPNAVKPFGYSPPTYSRSALVVFACFTTPLVMIAPRPSRTCCGDAAGLSPRNRAAAPVVWGVAIEVPLMMLVAVADVYQSLVMLSPGANQSTQLP